MRFSIREEDLGSYIGFYEKYLNDVQALNIRVYNVLNDVLKQSEYDKLQRLIYSTIDVYSDLIARYICGELFQLWKDSGASLRACLRTYCAGDAADVVCAQVEEKLNDLTADVLKIEKGDYVETSRPVVSDEGLDRLEGICKSALAEIDDMKAQYEIQAQTYQEENDIYGTIIPLIDGLAARLDIFYEESFNAFNRLHVFVQEVDEELRRIAEENAGVNRRGSVQVGDPASNDSSFRIATRKRETAEITAEQRRLNQAHSGMADLWDKIEGTLSYSDLGKQISDMTVNEDDAKKIYKLLFENIAELKEKTNAFREVWDVEPRTLSKYEKLSALIKQIKEIGENVKEIGENVKSPLKILSSVIQEHCSYGKILDKLFQKYSKNIERDIKSKEKKSDKKKASLMKSIIEDNDFDREKIFKDMTYLQMAFMLKDKQKDLFEIDPNITNQEYKHLQPLLTYHYLQKERYYSTAPRAVSLAYIEWFHNSGEKTKETLHEYLKLNDVSPKEVENIAGLLFENPPLEEAKKGTDVSMHKLAQNDQVEKLWKMVRSNVERDKTGHSNIEKTISLIDGTINKTPLKGIDNFQFINNLFWRLNKKNEEIDLPDKEGVGFVYGVVRKFYKALPKSLGTFGGFTKLAASELFEQFVLQRGFSSTVIDMKAESLFKKSSYPSEIASDSKLIREMYYIAVAYYYIQVYMRQLGGTDFLYSKYKDLQYLSQFMLLKMSPYANDIASKNEKEMLGVIKAADVENVILAFFYYKYCQQHDGIDNVSFEEALVRYGIDARVEQFFEIQNNIDRKSSYYDDINEKTKIKRIKYWFMVKEEIYPKDFECTNDEFIDALDRALKEKKNITEYIKKRVPKEVITE